MRTALIGYGEVGRILAEDLRAQGVAVSAFDIKLPDEAGAPLREHAAQHGVVLAASLAEAVRGAALVISAVTASQTGAVFSAKVASSKLGVASATKLCRSVMTKGLEAMLIESLTTARHYGVEDAVIASLDETYPGVDWQKQATCAFQRVIEHGRRRGEEMQQAARTVRDAGLTPLSAAGTAQRDTWMAEQGDSGVFGTRGAPGFARSVDWRVEADRILHSLATDRKQTPP